MPRTTHTSNNMKETTTSSSSTQSDGASPTLTTLLDIAGGVLARQMALFLSGRDALQLFQLSREWKQFMQIHEQDLFCESLQRDFAEGPLLIYAVNRRKQQQQERAENGEDQGQTSSWSSSFSYKQLYLAFQRRWKLPRDTIDDTEGGGSTNKRLPPIVVPWSNPYEFRAPPEEPSKDAQALVFILQVWHVNGNNGPETCGLLQWEEDSQCPDEDRLVLDETWYYDDDGTLALPVLKNQVCRWIDDWYCRNKDCFSEIREAIMASYLLTLHVVDLEKYQAATLMEKAPPADVEFLDDEIFRTICHGIDAVDLYGAKPPGSPYHTPFTDILRNHDKDNWYAEEHNVETFGVNGSLRLDRSNENVSDGENEEVFPDHQDGISFDFAVFKTVARRDEICSFLRALMKGKCHSPTRAAIASRATRLMTVPLQPTWVTDAAVLDNIISFSSFERQAGDLRLVCHQFDDSAIRQLETKLLEKVQVIGDDRWCDGWFKGSVRRGWSNDPFAVSKDSVIDESLCMAACRCGAFGCPGLDQCPGAVKMRASSGFHSESVVRKHLETKGWVMLKAKPGNRVQEPKVKIRFEEGEKSIFRVCDDLVPTIGEEVSYELVPESFQRFYGLASDMRLGQFVRSLFLVFLHTPCKDNHDGEYPPKRARLAQPSIGMASSRGDRYIRMKMIARFEAASGQPVEILLESKHNID